MTSYRVSLISCGVLATLLLCGCNLFRGDSAEASREPLEFEQEVEIALLWSERIGRGLGKKYVKITPAIVADRIVVADAYGLIVTLNRFTGDRVWQTRVGEPDRRRMFDLTDRSDHSFLFGGVGVGRGKVFVGTVRGHLIALKVEDGEEIWRTLLSGEVLAPPAVAEEVVVVQTGDGKMHALELDSGDSRWIFDTQNPILLLQGTASPVIASPLAIAGFANGLVAAINLESGLPVWEQRVTMPEGTTELDRIVDVDGKPLVLDRIVYAASHQGKVRAMNRESGDIIWEATQPSYHALTSSMNRIFVVRDDNIVVAIHQDSGDELWRQDSLQIRNRLLTDPLAYGEYVVLGDDQGDIHVLAQEDGRLVGSRKLGGAMRSPMISFDDIIYVLDNKGKLQALSIQPM